MWQPSSPSPACGGGLGWGYGAHGEADGKQGKRQRAGDRGLYRGRRRAAAAAGNRRHGAAVPGRLARVAIGAGEEAAGRIVREVAATWGSSGRATVLFGNGPGGNAAAPFAALANGTLA